VPPTEESLNFFKNRRRKGIGLEHKILSDLKKNLANLKPQQARQAPFIGEIVNTFDEAARALGLSRMTLYRYRKMMGDFPTLPVFRGSLLQWRRRFYFRRGPQPSQRRKMVVCMREEGMTFSKIGRSLGISKSSTWGLWQRHRRQRSYK
jgi:DNA invertase Pin-like site-specific DNA recombinase